MRQNCSSTGVNHLPQEELQEDLIRRGIRQSLSKTASGAAEFTQEQRRVDLGATIMRGDDEECAGLCGGVLRRRSYSCMQVILQSAHRALCKWGTSCKAMYASILRLHRNFLKEKGELLWRMPACHRQKKRAATRVVIKGKKTILMATSSISSQDSTCKVSCDPTNKNNHISLT